MILMKIIQDWYKNGCNEKDGVAIQRMDIRMRRGIRRRKELDYYYRKMMINKYWNESVNKNMEAVKWKVNGSEIEFTVDMKKIVALKRRFERNKLHFFNKKE